MTPAPANQRIDRANRVRCIACHAWVAPDERLQAAFRGGHNVRFYVCRACISEYKRVKTCYQCETPLNVNNIDMYRWRGKVLGRAWCTECRNEKNVRNYKAIQRGKLSKHLKKAVR